MIWSYLALAVLQVVVSSQHGLTQVEARRLGPDALAERVLGMTGRTVREARVWGGLPPSGSFRQLGSIEFASKPGASEGLCLASHIHVRFAPLSRDDGSADPRSAPVSIDMSTRWAILPSVPPLSGFDDPAGRQRAANDQVACDTLGPVLADPGKATFFRAGWRSNEREATVPEMRFIADLLRRADVASPALVPVLNCELESTECRNARATLTAIDALKPGAVYIDYCANVAGAICIDAEFPQPPFGDWQGSYILLRVETDATTPFMDARIVKLTLSRRHWVV